MDMVSAKKVDDDAHGPWVLPEGWAWTPLGVISTLRGEKVDPRSEPHLPFVGMDDIEAHGTEIVQTRPFGTMKSAGNRFHKDDVLYGRLRPYLNKTALAAEGGACSGELLAITPSNAVSPKYLQLFMHARRFVNTAMSTVSGDRPRIDFATIAAFDFPLAPLDEQRRIVSRVAAFLAEIAEGEAALAAARKGLDTFRRALLKAAVTGELTKDWRENNPVTETGHDLLARIAKTRAGNAPAKGRGHRAATASLLETSTLPSLPDGWARATAGELFIWSSGDFLPSSQMRAGPHPVYGGNGIAGWHDVANVNVPTIVIGRVGFYCGAIYLTNGPSWITDNAIYAKERPVILAIAYLSLVLEQSNIHQRSQGGAQPFVNQRILNDVVLPIPSHEEQAEILRRVSEALAASADTLAMLDTEAAGAAQLKQSILKAAFEGRLAPQDPADEPATELLARLRVDGAQPRRSPRGRHRA